MQMTPVELEIAARENFKAALIEAGLYVDGAIDPGLYAIWKDVDEEAATGVRTTKHLETYRKILAEYEKASPFRP